MYFFRRLFVFCLFAVSDSTADCFERSFKFVRVFDGITKCGKVDVDCFRCRMGVVVGVGGGGYAADDESKCSSLYNVMRG